MCSSSQIVSHTLRMWRPMTLLHHVSGPLWLIHTARDREWDRNRDWDGHNRKQWFPVPVTVWSFFFEKARFTILLKETMDLVNLSFPRWCKHRIHEKNVLQTKNSQEKNICFKIVFVKVVIYTSCNKNAIICFYSFDHLQSKIKRLFSLINKCTFRFKEKKNFVA